MNEIPARAMTVLIRKLAAPGPHEIRAEVQWDESTEGRRFFHVKHEPVPPCVSELIEAEDLHAISGGTQKMSGTTTIEGETILEVWSSVACQVLNWKLDIV